VSVPLYMPPVITDHLAFAREASDYFAAHPEKNTYTRGGGIEEGCLFAVRWGLEPAKAHAVLVLKVAEAEIWGDLDFDRRARHGESQETPEFLREFWARHGSRNSANAAEPVQPDEIVDFGTPADFPPPEPLKPTRSGR
jgi:hypothetical protein